MQFRFLLALVMVVAMSALLQPQSETNVQRALLLVANKGEHTLGLIDPAAGRQIATVDVGGVTGHEVIASPDGRLAYVPIYGNSGVGLPGTDGSTLAVIDIASRKIVGSVDFGHGVRPHCPLINSKDKQLYVTTEIDQAVSVIDPATLKVVGKVPTGAPESHMLAITRDGRHGYTANVGPGSVSVLDLESRKTITTIPVAPKIQRISLSVDDKSVFTADQTRPQLAVIDTATNKIKTWIPLPALGYGAAPTPDGHWLVVPLRDSKQVAVVDLSMMKVAHTLDVPAAPQEVLISPDGHSAYVSCDASQKVAVIRTRDWVVEKLIDAGRGVDGLAWAVAH